MNKNNNIDKLVEDALNSFDGAERATPMPWLLNRINKRLNDSGQQTFWDRASIYISRPVIAVPALALLLLGNSAAIFLNKSSSTVSAEQYSADTADDIQDNIGSFYDIVNATP